MRWIRRLPLPALFLALSWCGTTAWCQTKDNQERTTDELRTLRKSAENLTQIGRAMHDYHDANKRLPAAAIYGQDGKALLSWRVAILPYLGEKQRELYKQFKLDEPWDSEHNKELLDKMPAVYKSPAAKDKTTTTYYQVLTGPDTVFAGNQGMKLIQITDGTSNTILAVKAGEAVPWTKPADVVYDAKKPLPKFGGVSKTGFHILLCDASRWLVRPGFNEQTLRGAITPRGGEVIDLEKLTQR
jgi:hypothetical protein